MAKKELDFGKLALPAKPHIVKKEETSSAVEKAVETIHTPPPSVVTIPDPPTPSDEVKKVSLDLPVDMYTYVKMHTFTRRITMREYMLELISEDMKKRGAL
jgi:hypothetical protein